MLGHLQLINQVEITSPTGNQIITGVDDNSVYLLAMNKILPTSDTVNLRTQFTASGSPSTSASYDSAGLIFKDDANVSSSFNTGNTQFHNMVNSGNATDNQETVNGYYLCYDMFNSSKNSRIVQFLNQRRADQSMQVPLFSCAYKVNESNDGFNFFFNSGNIASGKFSLYKYLGSV